MSVKLFPRTIWIKNPDWTKLKEKAEERDLTISALLRQIIKDSKYFN